MKRFLPLLIILPLLIWIACEDSDSEVTLWGEVYSVENTTELDLRFNFQPNHFGLTGNIPPEIGYLTNLTVLRLNNNQLTGEIPESICDLTNLIWLSNQDSWEYSNSTIYMNQLCPPYPSCIEDYVGTQDTTNCD